MRGKYFPPGCRTNDLMYRDSSLHITSEARRELTFTELLLKRYKIVGNVSFQTASFFIYFKSGSRHYLNSKRISAFKFNLNVLQRYFKTTF
jgi:hypothetical protein